MCLGFALGSRGASQVNGGRQSGCYRGSASSEPRESSDKLSDEAELRAWALGAASQPAPALPDDVDAALLQAPPDVGSRGTHHGDPASSLLRVCCAPSQDKATSPALFSPWY